ncbi:MAG: hypothetical protein BRD23_05400 [Halobacteriales archaeon SW_9_67_25]|nr:MAG: hypothetical protein BRD23_05400 [Halobacteriales archaeon SW_9_67_25]
MPLKNSGPATEWTETDRFEADNGTATGGVGWIAHPAETMQRASHALAVDGEVWVVDPIDVPELDDRLAEFGDVAGVVVLLDRHKRDAGAVARRHDVPVYLPEPLRGVAGDIDAPVEGFAGELADTGYRTQTVVDNFAWTEVALYNREGGVLVVPEAVGTTEYFLAGGERLGVHPALRLKPPWSLARFEPDRILVGHGAGVHEDAAGALRDALSGARGRTPGLYLKNLKTFLPG